MSSTESEAIAAGDVWFEQGLFQGRPNWEQFLKLPTYFINNTKVFIQCLSYKYFLNNKKQDDLFIFF